MKAGAAARVLKVCPCQATLLSSPPLLSFGLVAGSSIVNVEPFPASD